MSRYAVGLGSNLGDRLEYLKVAVAAISRLGLGLSVSSLYETSPVGGPEQDPYLNAVVLIESDLTPPQMLSALQEIEQAANREREVRWGPRTLDLDIVAYDGAPLVTDDLVIPHPRAVEREFVLRPLAEVWPRALVTPGITAVEVLEHLGDQGVHRLLNQWLRPPGWHGPLFVAGQFAIIAAAAVGMATDGTLPEGEVTAVRVLGLVFAAVGAFLAFVSSRRLGTALTADPVPKDGGHLVTTGPFRLARHPTYGGVSLLLIGTAMILDSLWGFGLAVLLIPYFLVKGAFEERHLRAAYPDYAAYVETVPRRLIPFVV